MCDLALLARTGFCCLLKSDLIPPFTTIEKIVDLPLDEVD
jgi:hypothetical protein